jgi:hypothetical protein
VGGLVGQAVAEQYEKKKPAHLTAAKGDGKGGKVEVTGSFEIDLKDAKMGEVVTRYVRSLTLVSARSCLSPWPMHLRSAAPSSLVLARGAAAPTRLQTGVTGSV